MMNNGQGYRIALYIRLSLEDGKVESMSIANQKCALHCFVDSMDGVRDAEVLEYIDNGYSGTNFERPAVQNLLNDVLAGKINCIIVKDLTRFGRNSIEVGYFMERVFPLYGVRFISLNDVFDSAALHGDTGGVNAAFKYLAAEFYSRDLSIKYKSAKFVKFRRGEYQSKLCPYGYQKSADGRMEPDENTAQVVRWIFDMVQNGTSVSDVIAALYMREIPTPRQYQVERMGTHYDVSHSLGIWQRSTLLRLLHDERYTGTYIIGRQEVTEIGGHRVRTKDEGKWIKIPGHHPAIISKETFAQVQANLRHFRSVKKNVTSYPLKGKVFCGCCGHAMTRTAAKYPKFICQYTKVDNTALCHGLEISEEVLEDLVYKLIAKQAQIILNLNSPSNAGRIDVQFAELAEYERRVEGCMERKQALYEGLVSQEISLEEYKTQKAGIDVELGRWERSRTALAAQIRQAQMDETAQSVRLELAQEAADSDRLTTALAEKMVARVDVHPGQQIDISWKIKDFCVG